MSGGSRRDEETGWSRTVQLVGAELLKEERGAESDRTAVYCREKGTRGDRTALLGRSGTVEERVRKLFRVGIEVQLTRSAVQSE